MQLLFKFHQKRWRSKGLPGAFADARFRNFHLDIAKTFALKGQLGLFLLKLSGKPIAAIYGFKDQTKFYQYLSGFDPDYSKYSVGNQLTAYVMEKCIDDGLLEFDFMRGGEAYKDRWKTLSRWNYVAVIPRGILSNTFYWLYTKIWNYGNMSKNFFGNNY
jgi:CelD/BcsL family acetyltransferase involved in cellulose biosynthesis